MITTMGTMNHIRNISFKVANRRLNAGIVRVQCEYALFD